MFRRLTFLCLLLSLPFGSGCILTDAVGIPPANSISGSELADLISERAAYGWLAGCEWYISNFSKPAIVRCLSLEDKDPVVQYGNSKFINIEDQGRYPGWWEMFALIDFMVHEKIKIDENAYYSLESAQKCAAFAFHQAFFYTNLFLDAKSLPEQQGVGGGIARFVYSQPRSFRESAMLAAVKAVECDFERTGSVVELGPLSL